MLYLSPALTVYCCALALALGGCMGSFLNCMAWRVVHGESVWKGRSHCDVCGHVLGPVILSPWSATLSPGADAVTAARGCPPAMCGARRFLPRCFCLCC